jgi:hypothetical protein
MLKRNIRGTRIAFLILFMLAPLVGQSIKNPPKKQSYGCGAGPDLLARPVLHEMWAQDEGEHPYKNASGFIRIAVFPAFEPEFFLQVALNRNGTASVTSYSLPKGMKSISSLLTAELKRTPCPDVKMLASKMPIERRRVSANARQAQLIEQFFTFQLAARRIPNDTITLDSTYYEMEFVGKDYLQFSSDDYEAPMVKWIESFVAAAREGPQHEDATK